MCVCVCVFSLLVSMPTYMGQLHQICTLSCPQHSFSNSRISIKSLFFSYTYMILLQQSMLCTHLADDSQKIKRNTLRTGYWCVADGTGRKSVIKTRKKNYWNHSILFDNHAYYSCPWINQDGNWTNPLMTTILLKMLCCGRDTFLLPWTSKSCNFSEICFIKNIFV